jgi:hypothetical protein
MLIIQASIVMDAPTSVPREPVSLSHWFGFARHYPFPAICVKTHCVGVSAEPYPRG